MEIAITKNGKIDSSFNLSDKAIVIGGNRKYILPDEKLLDKLTVEFCASIGWYPVIQPFLKENQHKSEIIWDNETKKAKRIAVNN